jgi:hypothetical protein
MSESSANRLQIHAWVQLQSPGSTFINGIWINRGSANVKQDLLSDAVGPAGLARSYPTAISCQLPAVSPHMSQA